LRLLTALVAFASAPATAWEWESSSSWLEYQCKGVKDAWHDGTPDLCVTGYTHHDRDTYSAEKIDEFNEKAWGGGLGWSIRRDNGDSFGWYGIIFRDSHNQYTKAFGLAAITYWPKERGVALGLGYTAFLASRPDIWNNVPLPGVLPLASLRMDRLEILGTCIPNLNSQTGHGNVAFLLARWHF